MVIEFCNRLKMPLDILLVGCGVTSALATKLLSRKLEHLNLTIWEKQKGPGGRFYTIDGGTSCECNIDLGAQYITTSEDVIKFNNDVYETLFKNNIIEGMTSSVKGMKPTPDKLHYIAPLGMASIVKHLLKESKADVSYDHSLKSLNKIGNKWNAVTSEGKCLEFDVVVLTVPAPEILKISGDIKDIIVKLQLNESLESVKYSSRYALGIFFDQPLKTEFDSEYMYNDEVFRFVSYDGWKRKNTHLSYSGVLHTTIQFAEKYVQDDSSGVERRLIESMKLSFPNWPKQSSVIVHRWKYSQVLKPFCSTPGAILLSQYPLLIAGGDGFIGSTFDQCIISASKIVELLENEVGNLFG